jgi:3-dehydroquinate dehydratase-1
MKLNYCLPIIKPKKSEVLDVIKNAEEYQFYEIWLDYILDVDREFIAELLSKYSGKLIFVFRRKNLETPVMKSQTRLFLITLLEKTDSYVDLDIITQQAELSFIAENLLQLRVITSYHNFRETPDDKKLVEIMILMTKYNPTIFKIATMCQKPKDALRLLDLLISLKSEQKKYIIIGMGDLGTMTRIYGAMWGNEMVFAPQKDTDKSAPGQFTKTEMDQLIKLISMRS